MLALIKDTSIREFAPFLDELKTSLEFNNKPNVVLNLSSSYMLGTRLSSLVPPLYVDINDEKMFDMQYAKFLLENQAAFIDLMAIVLPIYEGKSVYIIAGDDEYKELISESLLKFIQQRYGIQSVIMETLEDIPDYYEEVRISLEGIYNLDLDKERYTYMTTDPNRLMEQVKEEDAK